MIKIPSISHARTLWKISSSSIAEVNMKLTDTKARYRSKLESFLAHLREHKEGIIGLYNHFSFSQKEDAYVVHMMLVKHPNVIISIENGYAKYTFTTAKVKYAMGMRALGLQFLTDNDTFAIRKYFKTSSDATFVNLLLTINSLLGLIKNNIIEFNIINLATSLAMPVDDILVSLTILKNSQLIKTYATNQEHTYTFSCAPIFSVLKEGDNNMATTKNTVVNMQEKFDYVLTWLKQHSSADHFQAIPNHGLRTPYNMILRIMLAEHPNIAFRPNNVFTTSRVSYVFAFVDAAAKINDANNLLSYRYIPHGMLMCLFKNASNTTLKENLITSLWILDYIYKQANNTTSEIVIYYSHLLNDVGIDNMNRAVNCMADLVTLNCIKLISVRQGKKSLSFTLQLLNNNSDNTVQSNTTTDIVPNTTNIQSNTVANVQTDVLANDNNIMPVTEHNSAGLEETINTAEQHIIESPTTEAQVMDLTVNKYINQLITQISKLNQDNAQLLAQIINMQYAFCSKQNITQLVNDTILSLKTNVNKQLQQIYQLIPANNQIQFTNFSEAIINTIINTNTQLIAQVNRIKI